MTIAEFIAKWRKVELKERSAAQTHFIDLCRVFDHPDPVTADPTGESFCFEKGAAKHGGGDGFADVWKRGAFGIEYKGKHKDLTEAYDQLLRYRDALESPPLLLCCDLDRIVIHTNFTGTVSATYDIPLEALAEPRNIEIMRAVFHDPDALRPGRTSTAVTQDAARHFAEIAAAMRARGLDPAAVAHFLDRLVFCLFAEDTRLLPDMVFSRIVTQAAGDPARFCKILAQLFDTMATGGDFGLEPIRHFNGNLFDDRTVLDLTADEVKRITAAATLDWSAVDPSIFGTLFERGLDPNTRAQLGAHFTSREDIELVVDAVVMAPLRREWAETKAIVERLLTTGRKAAADAAKAPAKPLSAAAMRKARGEADSILHQFLTRLRAVRVLDPACGSGNFLYVALLRLKDLEKEAAVTFPGEHGLGSYLPGVSPLQLYGIETNAYAHDLAQMTVWIGWLQWIRANGFGYPADPILKPLTDNIRRMDSILAPDGTEPDWPKVDFIIGNPPFLGSRFMRGELGEDYCKRLFRLYQDRLGGRPDLCCYWFEKARAHIAAGNCKRAGLLSTQGIRGGTNRNVLQSITESGGIFWAESDRPWILDGANVHVSMIGFDDGTEKTRVLDGNPVSTINANLTVGANTTAALPLKQNESIAFQGNVKRGSFDLPADESLALLTCGGNPNGRPNSDVMFPYFNASDLIAKGRDVWVIDFGRLPEDAAMQYERPFAHVRTVVRPERIATGDAEAIKTWWMHWRTRPELSAAIAPLPRFIATPRVSKHRFVCWLTPPAYPDCAIVAFARSDDYTFGVLHSRFHGAWALHMGTRLETRPRYTPTTCFETFPFPEAHAERDAAIAAAAKELNERRETWLTPPDWTRPEVLEFPGTVGGPWHRYIDPATVADRGAFKVGTVRYPRLVAHDADCAARLKERTLTKLYNERPPWLADCHARLDAAVASAYGWPADLPDEALLERLLALNQAAAG